MTDLFALNEEWAVTARSAAPSFIPSPTGEEFICAVMMGPPGELRLLILEGSRGEGKTSSGVMACLALAERLLREGRRADLPLRVAVVRDTWTNLERTTIESFEELRRKGLALTWKDGHREAVVPYGPADLVHFWFFGLDSRDDADKLQGFSCGVYWLEEVAPAAGLASGIPVEALGLGVTSVRQARIPPRLLVTMNPPDADHWIVRVEEQLAELQIKEVRVARFLIPPGEKSAHFRRLAETVRAGERAAWEGAADEFDAYRTRNAVVLEAIGRADLVARLVRGERGDVQVGEPVVPMFNRKTHVAAEPLPTFAHVPLVLGFDGGASPSCVVLQDLADLAGVNVLGSHTLENASMEQLIRDWLYPFLQRYGLMPRTLKDPYGAPRRRGYEFRVIGDPSLQWEGATSRAENAAGLVIQELLGIGLEPGPVEWSARREAAHAAFWRAGKKDRPRFIQIDPTENDLLIKALGGRFRYPKNMATGRVIQQIQAAKKESGPLYSGTPDALFYPLAVLHPAYEWLVKQNRTPVPRSPVPEPKSWMGT